MKRFIYGLFQALVMLVAVVCGGAGVLMAGVPAGVDMTGAGKSVEGGQTRSNVEPNTDPEFYAKDIDQRIAKIRPQSTMIDTMTRQVARKRKVSSLEVKVYELGSRSIMTTLLDDYMEPSEGEVSQGAATATLNCKDNRVFSYGDQILVEDITGYEADGKTESTSSLVLLVLSKTQDGQLNVVAVNGKTIGDVPNCLPTIISGTKLVRMGKACAESDAQVPTFAIAPQSRMTYCQNYMFQISQSMIDRMSSKEAPFTFSDVEEEAIFDMKRGQELSRLFSKKNKIYHPTKNELMYTTEGLWYQAMNDFTLSVNENGAVSASVMVDLMKKINTGQGAGSKKKVLIAGSDLLSALTKMELDKLQVLKEETDTMWGVEFTGFSAFSSKLFVVHSELFDEVGRSDQGLIVDPEELTQGVFLPFERRKLDLKKAGTSNSDDTVFQQIDCVYIANRYTATRVKLQ